MLATESVEYQDAIRSMHGADATYVESVEVHEKMPDSTPLAGKTVWNGTVHVFSLNGHASAKRCYAWRWFNDDSQRWNYVTVLHVEPVDSPTKAVQAYIMSEYQKRR